MPVRMTGMISGLDTETLIKGMVDAQKLKNKRTTDKSTLLEWKQEKWKDLNAKIYKLYTEDLGKLRMSSTFSTKKVASSNENIASVTGAADAPLGTQTLEVSQLASAQMITGGQIKTSSGSLATGTTTLKDLGIEVGNVISIKAGEKNVSLEVTEKTTINSLVTKLKDAGLNANFDSKQGRLFISSKATGKENTFEITTSKIKDKTDTSKADILTSLSYEGLSAANKSIVDSALSVLTNRKSSDEEISKAEKQLQLIKNNGDTKAADNDDLSALIDNYKKNIDKSVPTSNILSNIGLTEITKEGLGATKPTDFYFKEASNSKFKFNDVEMEDSSNIVALNGFTMTLKGTTATGEKLSLTSTSNAQENYDMVKKFITSYNAILKEMNELYYAESSRGYDPLSDDERESMTEDQIEKWETKIKSSILRRDNTINSLLTSMRSPVNMSFKIDGSTYSLASFGIETSKDFTEKGLLHIHGDKTDSTYSALDDKLLKAFQDNPDAVIGVLSGVTKNLYESLDKQMSAIPNVRSKYTVYNDKLMAEEQTRHKKKISELESNLVKMENKYYKQFAAMEKAMANMQSQGNALAGMLGTGTQQ